MRIKDKFAKIRRRLRNHLLYMFRRDVTYFLNHNIEKNTVLLVECNSCHHECLPGYWYLLKKMGYNVEIITPKVSKIDVFSRMFPHPDIWVFSLRKQKDILSSPLLKKFHRVVFNSKVIYGIFHGRLESSIDQCIPDLSSGKLSNLYVQHHIDMVSKNGCDIVLANPSRDPALDPFVVNPHYFGEVAITPKNEEITNFIVVGDIDKKRRDYSALIGAVEKLSKSTTKFKITVIGKGDIKSIPEEIAKYFDVLGRVDFSTLYEEVEKSDFFLTLVDPTAPQYIRYARYATTGTFQLVYGFLTPCIIHSEFANIHGFSKENSVIYESAPKLYEAMLKAVKMSREEYSKMQEALKMLANDIERKSVDNLKCLFQKACAKS